MLTVINALKLAIEYLNKKGIESPRLSAELLLADVLKCKRLDLYLLFERPLCESEIIKYRTFISRRRKFEPIQYIIGLTEFFGLHFKVNNSVLIPRPETEILVETILNNCSYLQTNIKSDNKINILDIGCGSGNIAITISKRLPNSEITAIEISEDAVKIAKENAVRNKAININFMIGDFSSTQFNENKFDIIVSNPPYVSKEEYPTLQKEIIDFEPAFAVTDFNDGLSFYRIIAERARILLKQNGKIYLEIGKGQAHEVKKILEQNSFTNISFVKDYQQIDRVIVGEYN
jgi:release factor glutamine methyltransferase